MRCLVPLTIFLNLLVNANAFTAVAPSSRFARNTLLREAADDDNDSKAGDGEEEESGGGKTPKFTGHQVNSDKAPQMQIDPEEMKIQKAFMKHQQDAPKLGWATDIRTLVEYNHGYAVISTNSKSNPGFPGGSVIGFAPDDQGRPIFIFSKISSHTQDILADPRASVTIASKEFKGAADGRVSLMGKIKPIKPGPERDAARESYMKKHPNAFWVDFGDFIWFRMEEIEAIRFVGGFARAGSVTAEEYAAAKPDEVSAIGGFVAAHMNEDHESATIAMIGSAIPGLDVTEATITSVDSLGMYVKVSRTPRSSDQPQQFKLRLPFPRPAEDRKDVKNIIVEMTKAAAAAAPAASATEETEETKAEETEETKAAAE